MVGRVLKCLADLGIFYFISLQDYRIDLLIANGQIGFCCFVLISSVCQIFY